MALHFNVGYSWGMKTISIALAALLLVHLMASCATKKSYVNSVFQKDRARYHVKPPGPGWSPVRIPEADLAWVNEASGSSLLVNSMCKNAGDAPLLALTGHLLIGMTDQKVNSQNTLPWSGREALETDVLVKIDGVPRRLMTFVMKKDACIYDIVFAAPPTKFDEQVPVYFKVRDQFSVEGRK
jgi:hypothetical protein